MATREGCSGCSTTSSHLPGLCLQLGDNELSGSLPVEWSQLGELRQLALRSNLLSGALPSEWSALSQLWYL
jgi:hypothetical protein